MPSGPCRYCPVWHGNYWFPCLTTDVDNRYAQLAIVKKHLCKPVMKEELTCDPERCRVEMRNAEEPVQLVLATQRLWREYYDHHDEGGGGFDDIIEELELEWSS